MHTVLSGVFQNENFESIAVFPSMHDFSLKHKYVYNMVGST